MKNTLYKTNRHSCYLLQYHLVVATKYRHPVIDEDIFNLLQDIAKNILETKNHCNIIKINYCSDHIHILFEAPPQVCLSVMINSFKTVTSRLIRKSFPVYLRLLELLCLWRQCPFQSFRQAIRAFVQLSDRFPKIPFLRALI